MSTRTITDWWHARPGTFSQGLMYLLLLAAAAGLVGVGLKRARFGNLSLPRTNLLEYFDSFSEPSIAAAILRREVENLTETYVVNPDDGTNP
jgi:hypothetical protein